MTTPIDILTAAFGRSTKNRPAEIVSQQTALVEVVMRAMRGIYSFAAEINPEFFGRQEAVNFVGGGWARPALAESVFYIENPGGAEVIVVPRQQRTADLARPALWRLGGMYFSAGNALDPVAETLQFFYSKRAEKPASPSTAFDASWPTDFDGLLVDETAIYLAVRDGRLDEASAMLDGRDRNARRFAAFLSHETVNVVYQYGSTRNVNIPHLIKTLLAGVPGEG